MACILHTEGNTLMNCKKMRKKKKVETFNTKNIDEKKN